MFFVLVFLLVSRMPVILIVSSSGLCGCVPCFRYHSVGRFNPPLCQFLSSGLYLCQFSLKAYCSCVFVVVVVLFLILHYSLVGNLGCLTRVRLQQPQEQHYPFLSVCQYFYVSKQCQFGGFSTCVHMWVHAIAYGGCANFLKLLIEESLH